MTDVRRLLMLFCFLPLLGLRTWMLYTAKPLSDFIVYWSAGHLFLTGGRPYADAAIYATERLQGWTLAKHLVMLCPPWALPVSGLMALLPFQPAHLLWLAVSLALNCFSALGLWSYFGGEKKHAWMAILIAATLIPMGFAEWQGQITPVILACLTAFLLLMKSHQPFAAGLFLLGFGLKPQLLYLVSLAVLLWIVKSRSWQMLFGAVVSYGVATAAAFFINPNSFDYFRNAYGAAVDTSCGIGGALRVIFGTQHVWLQILPTICGFAWFAVYWTRHRRNWDWQIHIPLLVLISICTSPYFWFHDFILILPTVIALAVRGSFRSLSTAFAYFAVQAAIFMIGLPPIWMCAASVLWLAFYAVARRAAPTEHTSRTVAATAW